MTYDVLYDTNTESIRLGEIPPNARAQQQGGAACNNTYVLLVLLQCVHGRK